MQCISLRTQSSFKDLCVARFNSSQAQTSSNDLSVVHYTSLHAWDSYSNLCVARYNSSCALSSFRALYASHKNYFCYTVSNLGRACTPFLIFPFELWPKLFPCSKSILILAQPRVITRTSASSSFFWFSHGSTVTMLQCAFFSSHFFNKSG